MKQMLLTGLATEQDFSGEVRHLLVFNKGDLRVPVSEDAAAEIIKAMAESVPNIGFTQEDFDEEREKVHRERDDNDVTDEDTDEDGVPQL